MSIRRPMGDEEKDLNKEPIAMPNKFTRRNEDSEPETYHSRQQDTEAAQDTEPGSRTRLATGGRSYPSLSTTSPWNAPIDHGFHPERDRIAETDVTSMTFGQALSGKSVPPQEPCLVSAPATEGGEAPPATAASPPSSLKRRL
jgi:hypothetical protein